MKKIIGLVVGLAILAMVIAIAPAVIGIGLGVFFIKKSGKQGGNKVYKMAGVTSIGIGVLMSIGILFGGESEEPVEEAKAVEVKQEQVEPVAKAVEAPVEEPVVKKSKEEIVEEMVSIVLDREFKLDEWSWDRDNIVIRTQLEIKGTEEETMEHAIVEYVEIARLLMGNDVGFHSLELEVSADMIFDSLDGEYVANNTCHKVNALRESMEEVSDWEEFRKGLLEEEKGVFGDELEPNHPLAAFN